MGLRHDATRKSRPEGGLNVRYFVGKSGCGDAHQTLAKTTLFIADKLLAHFEQ